MEFKNVEKIAEKYRVCHLIGRAILSFHFRSFQSGIELWEEKKVIEHFANLLETVF